MKTRQTIELIRETSETRVRVIIDGDPSRRRVTTALPMLSHFLDELTYYSGLGIVIEAAELEPTGDGHHLTEDVAITLGQALHAWLGDRSGLARFGQRLLPMDEALARCAIDLGGRPCAVLDLPLSTAVIGGLLGENVIHFFRSLASEARVTLHLAVSGENAHHQAEACFKAFGLALAEAVAPFAGGIRSTKGRAS